MSKRKNLAGLTSLSLPLFAGDSSSSTGAGLSGLAYNSSGLSAEYRRQGSATWTAITLSAGILGTWSSGGFVADGALGGSYELGVPNAAVAAGAQWVAIRLYGATNMLPILVEIELDGVNYQDAVHFGLSALPAVAAGGPGGLPTGDGSGHVTLTASEHAAISSADLPAALTAQGYTTARAGYLDALNGIVASIWSSATAGLTAAGSIGLKLANWTLGTDNKVLLSANAQTGVTIPTVSAITNPVSVGGYAANQDPATLVLDAAASGHNTAATVGAKINASGASGDPLANTTGTYATPGTVGYAIGHNLDAQVSTRSTYAGGDTPGTTTLIANVAALASGSGLFMPGTVSTAIGTNSFIVQFSGSAPAPAGLVGLYCCNTSPAHAPEKQQITTATAVDSTHLTLTFAVAFGVAPSVGDAVLVG